MTEDRGSGRAGSRPGAGAPAVVMASVAAVLIWPYAWWAVARPPFSAAAAAAVVLPGVAVAGVAAAARSRSRGPRRPPPAAAGVRRWLGLAALAAVWQVAAYLQHPRHDHPTLSSLANAVLESHTARAAAFVAWLAVTVALVRR
jgi:hypothetical protein